MIVVSDTTALTSLIKAGLGHVLPDLFGTVVVPEAVARELVEFHREVPPWCRIVAVIDGDMVERLRASIDLGEAEAIALALQVDASILLLDDRKGRRRAGELGVVCVAVPALLVAAKRRGVIASVKEALDLLSSGGRYRVSDSAAEILLRSVGEV